MANPRAYLPPVLSDKDIENLLVLASLPLPCSISKLDVSGDYHDIYALAFPPATVFPKNILTTKSIPAKETENVELILRVSGNHLPRIKTVNEVAILVWLGRNTSIPVPTVICYDATTKNPLKHEYILLSRAPGRRLRDNFHLLDEQQKSGIVDQLIDFTVELNTHEWHHIGGLQLNEVNNIVPGRVVEETLWQATELDTYWPNSESLETVNIKGPYRTYTEYAIAHLRSYQYAIRIQEPLAFVRDCLPRIDRLIVAISHNSTQLDQIKLRLAHKDFHTANLMYDIDSGLITSVLDWEFSGIVPLPQWNVGGTFLMHDPKSPGAKESQQRMMDLLNNRCQSRGISILKDAEYSFPLQEKMQLAIDSLAAIIETSVRSKDACKAEQHKVDFSDCISAFGV